MRHPNLNALRMFEVTGRLLNFRLAADEANLTQGAVAQQVRKLEGDLGVQLFERQARGLAFTSQGFKYHQAVSRGLDLINMATEELLSEDRTVAISMPPSFASKWLVPRLSDFARDYPAISIEAIASKQLEDFRSGRVDFAIRQGRPAPERGLTIHHLAPARLVAVCSPAMAAEAGPVDHPEHLLDFPLIEDGHNHWTEIAAAAGRTVDSTLRRFNQTALALEVAAGGQGIAIAPELLTALDVSRGRLAVVWEDDSDTDFWFHAVHRRDQRLGDNAAIVLDWIAAAFV